jgi:hypothetical protein
MQYEAGSEKQLYSGTIYVPTVASLFAQDVNKCFNKWMTQLKPFQRREMFWENEYFLNFQLLSMAGSGFQNAGLGRAWALYCRLGLFAGLGAYLVKLGLGLGFYKKAKNSGPRDLPKTQAHSGSGLGPLRPYSSYF